MSKFLNENHLPTETPRGDMNFIGAAVAFFDEITRNCNQDTKETYIGDYNDRIFPLIDELLPISAYTEQTLEELYACLQREKNYSESTMLGRCHHLLYDPFEAYQRWFSPVWYKRGRKSKRDAIAAGEQLLKTPKSLSVKQELLAAQILLENPKTRKGEYIGLSLMFLSALRNAEACGLNFGDALELREYPGCYYLQVYKTTIGNRNMLKGSGKTRNAPRNVPIPKVLYDFIKAREEVIVSSVAFPCTDRRGRVFRSVLELPIACRGEDYAERCGAADLTEAGRKLLRETLRISTEELELLEDYIEMAKDSSEDIDEHEPTAYLFRRNMATHLYQLGFTPLQIYAYMGHDLRDELIERSDFVDEEYLHEMCVLLEKHPLNRMENREVVNAGSAKSVSRKNTTSMELVFPAGSKVREYQVQIRNREYGDRVKVSIRGGAGAVVITSTNEPEPPRSEINITKATHRQYEKAVSSSF